MDLHSDLGKFVKHLLKARRPQHMASAYVFQAPVAIGRVLLVLAAISLLTMPLTQDIWTWDHFLRGGHDFETGMLTIVMILCLAVLLSQLCKRHIDLLFAARRVLAFTFTHGELPGKSLVEACSVFRIVRANCAAIDKNSLPLRI